MLELRAAPEGGHFRETFRDAPGPDGRALSTAIYYLLKAGERSAWHRIDAAEPGIFTPVRRCSSAAPTAPALPRRSASAPIFPPANGRRRSFRPAIGSRPRASANGR